MAKKWIVMMLVACIGLGGGLVYIRQESDSQAPEIKCTDQAENEYDPSMSDADLLKGMMATDDKDGDVTSSLTVESVYEVDDSNVVVTYVAKDSANNIAKFKRDMQVNPDEMKKNTNSQKTSDNEDGTVQAEPTSVPVEDVETGEAPSDAQTQTEEENLTPTPELTPAASDEAAAAAKQQESAADAMPAQNPKVYLTDYYVKVPVGTSLNLLSYVKEIKDDKDDTYELWRRVQINGEVNTAAAGTYTCTFCVVDTDGNASNNAELTVVVE